MNWYEDEMKRRDDEALHYVMADKKGRWFMMLLSPRCLAHTMKGGAPSALSM